MITTICLIASIPLSVWAERRGVPQWVRVSFSLAVVAVAVASLTGHWFSW